MKPYKKYLLFLGLMIVLSPLGLVLPGYFNAGDAWGEWSVERVTQQTGKEPAGMKKDAEIYKAPVSKPKDSVDYVLSALIGTGIILFLTFGANKLMSRNAAK